MAEHLDITKDKRAVLERFISGESGMRLEVPAIPDSGDWPELDLRRPRRLVEAYGSVFRYIYQNAQLELAQTTGVHEHLFRLLHPNYFSDGSNLDQIVIQLKQGAINSNPHLFIEFLSQIPTVETPNLNSGQGTSSLEEPIPAHFPFNFDALRKLTAYLVRRNNNPKVSLSAKPNIGIEETESNRIEPEVKTTRLITVPVMDENCIAGNNESNGLFNRDLQEWWSRFFSTPSVEGKTWSEKVTPDARRVTAWTFYHNQAEQIERMEYFRKNKAGIYRVGRLDTPGIKLMPPNPLCVDETQSQRIIISLETGEVDCHFRGVILRGKHTDSLQYTLKDGMLDLKGDRFDQREWKFIDIVTDILADIPLEVEELPTENAVAPTA